MEPLADYANRKTEHIENERKNRTEINKIFRKYDESHKFPINNKFNATERAIKRLQKQSLKTCGLEYALALDNEISNIVNSEV